MASFGSCSHCSRWFSLISLFWIFFTALVLPLFITDNGGQRWGDSPLSQNEPKYLEGRDWLRPSFNLSHYHLDFLDRYDTFFIIKMSESIYHIKKGAGPVRQPRKQEYVLSPIGPAEHNPRHQAATNQSPSRSMSWSDPDELSQLLDFFTTPPLVTEELPRQVSYDHSSSTRVGTCRKERGPLKARFSESPIMPTSSTLQNQSDSIGSPRPVPLKAQRLMGIDTTTAYHRSTFDWEDEEQQASSPRRRSLIRRNKHESKNYPILKDSKWTALSQRFRSNSTTPVSQRFRSSSNSSPKGSFDEFLARDNPTIKLSSSERINSMIQTPVRPSFLVDQRKILSESKVKTVEEQREWAEARASSRALNSSIDTVRRVEANSSQLSRKNSSDSATSDIRVQLPRSTPPLRFNPSRRPRAPFPSDQFDSSSADEGKGPDKVLPLVSSPVLARCPSKMQMPSRIMRPIPTTPAKEEVKPVRPRRPTESNIFADKITRSPVKSSLSPTRRSNTTPPRQPPPSIPVPPLPSPLSMKQSKTKLIGKSEGLKVALGVQACSPLFSSEDKEFLQTSPETSPQAIVFCGEKVAPTFAVTIKQVERESTTSEKQVELIVGGVPFDAPLSVFLNGDSKAKNNNGLMASLQQFLKKQEHEDRLSHQSSSITLSVPKYAQSQRSKNTINSYDDGTGPLDSSLVLSSSSSEEESEEDIVPVFGYETIPMTWTHHVETNDKGEDLLNPVKTLQLATPHRSLAHTRSPTSVSLDCEESIIGDEEGDESSSSDYIHRRRNSATPELIGAHTFIFTSSSRPSSTQLHSTTSKPVSETMQVTLHRDPQPYPFILHLLKTGSLPSFFSEEQFSHLDRQRALQRLCLECRYLGYSGLAEQCNDALDAMSTRKMFSLMQ